MEHQANSHDELWRALEALAFLPACSLLGVLLMPGDRAMGAVAGLVGGFILGLNWLLGE